jgi:hypothetical protein
LKAIADAENQFPGILKLLHNFGQTILKLDAKNAAGSNIIAVTKTAGNAKHLVIGQQPRRSEQPMDVQHIGLSASELKRMRCFSVAIGARSSKYKNSRLHIEYCFGLRDRTMVTSAVVFAKLL